MNSIKLSVVIPESREVRIKLPSEVRTGTAEVIVVPIEEGNGETLVKLSNEWRAGHPQRRSRDEIDRSIEAEREAWGARR